MDFSELPLSDAVVVDVVIQPDVVVVNCLDWKEVPMRLEFEGVIAVELYNPIGVDLSHGALIDDDELLKEALRRLEDDEISSSYYCFGIWSAWSDLAVLKVVAESFIAPSV